MKTFITKKLNEKQLKDVEQLVNICNEYDKCNMSAITDNSEDEDFSVAFFLSYLDDTLIGFLSLYRCYNNFAEITAFTNPKFRGKHLFSRLLNLARKFCIEKWKMSANNMTISTFCDMKNADSEAVVKACGFKKMNTEYLLTYYRNNHFSENIASRLIKENITAKESNDDDFLIKLHSEIFNMPIEASTLYIKSMREEGLAGYIIYKNKTAIGMYYLLTIEPEEGQVDLSYTLYICALGILPKYQRNHYGNATLNYIIATCDETVSKLQVQVSDTNKPALKLYSKFGFKSEQGLVCYNL